ncbi:MAG: TRAP transporter small permease [Thermincolia bacterium]
MLGTVLLKLDAWLAWITEKLLWVVGIPFFAMIMVEVLLRKLANHSFFGVYELAGFLSSWVSMLGAYLAYRNREMARLTFLLDKLSPRRRHQVEVFNKLLVLAALIFLGVSGTFFIFSPAVSTQMAVAFEIPVIYAYIGIPIGMFLMAFETLLLLLIKGVNNSNTGKEAVE